MSSDNTRNLKSNIISSRYAYVGDKYPLMDLCRWQPTIQEILGIGNKNYTKVC